MESLDWGEFVSAVARMRDSGKSDVEISGVFGGRELVWNGVIIEMKLEDEFVPGVAVRMPGAKVTLAHDGLLQADHLFLNVQPGAVPLWREYEVGQEVAFRVNLSRGTGPFPAIRVSKADDVTLLMVGTDAAVPLPAR
jgi:hypothetical protein